jgi:hypothetical protein
MDDKTQTTNIEEFLSSLEKEMGEFAMGWGIDGIVSDPKGDRQDSEAGFDHVFVDQHGPMTDAGDDFQGDEYIPLPSGKYLKCWYYS